LPRERRPLRAWARGPARLARPAIGLAVVLTLLMPGPAAYAEPSIDQLEQQIEKDSIALEKVIEKYNMLNEQLKASRVASDSVATRLRPLRAQLDEASAQIGELSALAYKGGDLVALDFVMAAGSTVDLADRMTSLDGLTRFQNAEVARFAQIKSKVDAEAVRLDRLIAEQQRQREELTRQKTKINADLAKLTELRRQAYARLTARSPTAPATKATPPIVAGKAGVAVRFAYAQLGKPYVWAADGPGSYDCSGLTMAAWKAAGVSLPHNAAMQWNALPHIQRASLRPGDLVFYYNLGHVGIYVGNSQIIHAPTTGDVVKLAPVDRATPYGYARPG
jgi:cell wall-associated NlpC family hydrolase